MEARFDRDTAQMAATGYRPQDGLLIDSSWGPAPKQRNRRAENEALKEGRVPPESETQPHQLRQKDRDATWSCQHRQWEFGYKNHINVDRQYKFIMQFAVTTASSPELMPFESILMPTDTCRGVWADRAYSVASVTAQLEHRGCDHRIIRRATRKHPDDECERQANQRRVGGAGPGRTWARRAIRQQLGGPGVRAIGRTRVRYWVGLKNLLNNMHRFIQLEYSAPAMP